MEGRREAGQEVAGARQHLDLAGVDRPAGVELADFSMGSPSLEEVFFALTGGGGMLGAQQEKAA